jgi:hypothetical protein
MSRRMRLTWDRGHSIASPPLRSVLAALERLEPQRCTFVTLTLPGGDYVQTAGSRERLTVERRSYDGDSFRHVVFGLGPERPGEGELIDCAVGPIVVLAHEVLALSDAVAIFTAAYRGLPAPKRYTERDITAMLS